MIIERTETTVFNTKAYGCDVCGQEFELKGFRGHQCCICLRVTHWECGSNTWVENSARLVWLCSACLALPAYAERLDELGRQVAKLRQEWADASKGEKRVMTDFTKGTTMNRDEFFQKILTLAAAMVAADTEHLNLVQNEEDESAEPQPEATTFLKFNGKRLGRDLELYRFMFMVKGAPSATIDFLEDVVIRLKQESPKAFAVGITHLRAFNVFGDQQAGWDTLLNDLSTQRQAATST